MYNPQNPFKNLNSNPRAKTEVTKRENRGGVRRFLGEKGGSTKVGREAVVW